MEIMNSTIREAEIILIGGKSFDEEERIPFIKNLETRDLLAVPGSGKTTALLAKLYCIAKSMPFADGAGVLVLSHTNAAVDEIESKLKPHCPQLFQYPNFVGTVQSFVNTFLALPYYSSVSKHKIQGIDDGMYRNEIDFLLSGKLSSEVNYFKYRRKDVFYEARFWFNVEGERILSKGIGSQKLSLESPQKWVKEGTSDEKIKNVEIFIDRIKQQIFKKGVLHFDDCYYLARCFINKNPSIINILQHRFKYVFIDEAQDLEQFQLDLIDTIFFHEHSTSIIQRIGDLNQSIYSSEKTEKTVCDWIVRDPMYLKNSNRLTTEIAEVVDCFTHDRQLDENENPQFQVVGINNIGKMIPAHLLLFDEFSVNKLKWEFEKLIREFNLHEIHEGKTYGFKIIGWSGSWAGDEPKGYRLEELFPSEYSKKVNNTKESYQSLSEYLQFSPSSRTMLFYRKNILSALCCVLRLAGRSILTTYKGREMKRYLNQNNLMKHIRQICDDNPQILTSEDLSDFQINIYRWSKNIASQNDMPKVYDELKDFIVNNFTSWFEIKLSANITMFLGDIFTQLPAPMLAKDEIPIEIKTVHSVKGQTHCATMYVETSYYKYESEKLDVVKTKATKTREQILYNNPLLKQHHNFHRDESKRSQQAIKMMYVGFSRPTHLLCFAALKENMKDKIEDMEKNGWKKIDLTEKYKH